ncbi:MAG: hypothetical protein KKH02_00445 [Proteobacteria bacterium]|nr:hypothetical protein [Pseudomonadota bacterium]MBU4580886.1 hypothetical protein [Pseudomonadota bacterium]MCG2740060.1 hypothetical protein [Syntrophaceae bacterium]
MRKTDEAMAMLKKQKTPWYLVIVFLVVSAGLVTAGYFFYQLQKGHIVVNVRADIASVADFKVQRIVRWRQEIMTNARVFQQNMPRISGFRELMRDPLAIEPRQGLLKRMKTLQEVYFFIEQTGKRE